jgi:hypothetical protein
MRAAAFALLFLLSSFAEAQVYRWVDQKGTVHYSNEKPPAGTKATVVNIDARTGPPSPDTQDCYTVRCQGERMEERLARREESDARAAAARAAAAPPAARGLDFRKYISLQRGMSEGELLGIAGPPDFQTYDYHLVTYTYMPTPGDPFTTTISLVGGRIRQIERVRKF